MTEKPPLEEMYKHCDDPKLSKMFYALYSAGQKPKIKYPPVKLKTKEQLEEKKIKEPGSCPQKTQIDYPKPVEVSNPIHPVDTIPKRKPESEIMREIKNEKNKPLVKPKMGQNRAALIDNLQEKFQFTKGKSVPEAAQTTGLALSKKPTDAPHQTVSLNKGFKVPEFAKDYIASKYNIQENSASLSSGTKNDELMRLYGQIENEILERQQYLEDVLSKGPNKQIEEKMKMEIATRFGELQKIKEML